MNFMFFHLTSVFKLVQSAKIKKFKIRRFKDSEIKQFQY